MSTYTNLRWETAPEGLELWGLLENQHFPPFEDRIELLAWIYKLHKQNKWMACVYDPQIPDAQREFDSLEDAKAWCHACVRMS